VHSLSERKGIDRAYVSQRLARETIMTASLAMFLPDFEI
jgi:hypothetical protein